MPDIAIESLGPPVAAKTYTPFWPPFARNKPQVTEELYIFDEEDSFFGLHKVITTKKDGTVEERVLDEALSRIIDKDDYLSLVNASTYEGFEEMGKRMQSEGRRSMEGIVDFLEDESLAGFIQEAKEKRQQVDEYVAAHDNFMLIVWNLDKSKGQLVCEFDREIYDKWSNYFRKYFQVLQQIESK